MTFNDTTDYEINVTTYISYYHPKSNLFPQSQAHTNTLTSHTRHSLADVFKCIQIFIQHLTCCLVFFFK